MAELLSLGTGIWVFCAAAVLVGTVVQRIAGQGLGMIATPMVALVAPHYLPATVLLVGLAVGLSSASVDRAAIAPKELPPGFAGRALGAAIAAWLASWLVGSETFATLIALVIFAGIALSLLGARVRIAPPSLFLAGTAAGVMGTLTAVGAPPMALLYQHEEARRSAAMQNAFFGFGMIVSILALLIAGLVAWRHVVLAATLLPVVALGLALAQPLAKRYGRRQMRPVALSLSGLAACVLLLRQVL